MGIGTSIVTRAGPSVKLTQVETKSLAATVYNFEVEDLHTYFVGQDGLWVHNKCPSLDDLAAEAGQLDKGGLLTKAGRALQKKVNRGGTAFKSVNGNHESWNNEGMRLVENMLTDPLGTAMSNIKQSGRYGPNTVFRSADGLGVRFDSAGKWIGFLEP